MAICPHYSNLGVGIANYWSRHSRISNQKKENPKPGEQEWLVIFCRELLKTHFYDYLVFGHRHLPLNIPLNEKSTYINLGEVKILTAMLFLMAKQ